MALLASTSSAAREDNSNKDSICGVNRSFNSLVSSQEINQYPGSVLGSVT